MITIVMICVVLAVRKNSNTMVLSKGILIIIIYFNTYKYMLIRINMLIRI